MQLAPLLCAVSLAVAGCASAPTPGGSRSTATPSDSVQDRAKPHLLFERCKNLADYPKASRQRREAGTVRIAMNVDVTGIVTRTEVVQSSGFTALDQTATETLSRCPFLPAIKDGRPVEAAVEITYVWKLE